MNCIDLFVHFAKNDPDRPALWMPSGVVITFGELQKAAAEMQHKYLSEGIKKGDGVLLFAPISPRLYAAIIAILALGCHVVLVEPWMPLPLLNRALSLVKPKLFLTNLIGRAWGLRAQEVRSIPRWCGWGSENIKNTQTGCPLTVEDVPPETIGIITFTTGTTGSPKGVVRTHEFLVCQHQVISNLLNSGNDSGADLCVFANFALTNLASGRCSLLVPSKWDHSFFEKLSRLPAALTPVSATCGPAFLKKLIEFSAILPLKSIHIGGALTDCDLFEQGFSRFPNARWLHVYGSSEAEPVAVAEAHQAVAESRRLGYFQTLYFGKPVPEITARIEEDTVWVSGRHVSTFYLADEESNRQHKFRDESGVIWHDMGDRLIVRENGWWYGGRSSQEHALFALEQQVYTYLQTSNCFIHRAANGELYLLGEDIYQQRDKILHQFSELKDVFEVVVHRDRRHRARIDRQQSIRKGAPWIVG